VTVSADAVQFLGLDASTYRPHSLHAGERIWTETNCYVDLWVEVLHALGQEPLASCAYVFSADFECDQWTFIKFPAEDLRAAYGIDVNEMAVWRPILDHVSAHLQAGRLLTVEVDAWWLPDTRGTSYRTNHVKTTIVPASVSPTERSLGYFHNAGYYELADDDFDGLFAVPALPPYVEDVKLTDMRQTDDGLIDIAVELTREHLGRRPSQNPVERMGEHIQADLDWLATAGLDMFHEYAFVTLRQFGATAELAASFVEWLDRHAGNGVPEAAGRLRSASETAKALQFGLARVARGRVFDVVPSFEAMARDWDDAITSLAARYG
jgi:hypothetical protein